MENNNFISQKKSHRLFFWGICFILFLPIIILPPAFEPSVWSRAILFRTVLTLLISFLSFKFLYKKDISLSIPKKKNPVYLPFLMLLAFFIVLIIATLFSQDLMFSIFGSPKRAGGILNLLFFFLFAVFLALFIDKNDWKKLFHILFGFGVLISLLAVVQYFNLLKNVFISFESGGTPSFLGNATFLAIYMLFLTFLSFTLLTQEKDKKKKWAYGALFLLFGCTILITGARATYLGLLIGFFFFIFFYPKKFKLLKIVASSFVLFVIIVAVLFNIFPQIAEKNNLFKMTAGRLSIKGVMTDLAGTRFSAWKIAFQAIKDKPIWGWGPENFYIGFEKYYDTNTPGIKDTWWDRPHNAFLDIAVSSGIISLILYFLFWLALFWQLQKFKRRQGDDERAYLAHGLQTMFIAYLTALFFNFDDFSTYLISFFFIGYAFHLISNQGEQKIIQTPKTNFFKKKFAYIPLLLILICFIWFWNIKPLYLNEKINYAEILIAAKKCDKAINMTKNIWQGGGILTSYAGLKYTDFIKQCATAEKEVEYVLSGTEALKSASLVQPNYTRTWLVLAGFINVLAAKEEDVEKQKKLLLEARGYLEKALELSPKRQEIFIEMEKNYIMAKDYQKMKKTAEDCLEIDSGYGQCYWYLGIAEIFLGDQENGKKHIQRAQEGGAVTPPYIQLGVAYISQKNYKDAAEAYRMATVYNNDKNAGWHAVLAFLYKKIKEYDKAGKEAIKVFELEPENKEAMDFLKQLLGLSPNDPSLHSSLAYVYKQMGEDEKARQEYLIVKSLYLQAAAKYPKEGTYRFNLAGVYKELGEYEKSYYEAVLAKKIDPGLEPAVLGLLYTLPENYIERYRQIGK